MSEDITALSATALLQQFRQGGLSPVEVSRVALDRIDKLDGAINAFCLVEPETTLRHARESE